MYCTFLVQSSRARKNEANYQERTGSDDNDDDVSLRSDSPNSPQPASKDSNDLEVNMVGEVGDLEHRTEEEEAPGKSAEPPKLYLFSGGGFCVPEEEDGTSGVDAQPNAHCDGIEGQSNGTGDPDSSLQTEDAGLTSQTQPTTGLTIANLLAAGKETSTQVDASAGIGLRAMPMLRRKRPSKQP